MFYTDWSMSSKIGRADLDGQNQVILVSKKVVHPHGITLDFVKQHLYWGDSYLDFIERVDYNGDHRTTIAYGLNVRELLFLILYMFNIIYVYCFLFFGYCATHCFDMVCSRSLLHCFFTSYFTFGLYFAVLFPILWICMF